MIYSLLDSRSWLNPSTSPLWGVFKCFSICFPAFHSTTLTNSKQKLRKFESGYLNKLFMPIAVTN